jgi:hypothetical protein
MRKLMCNVIISGYLKETSKSPGEIQKLADHSNDKKTAAKRVGELSSELFFAVFVKVFYFLPYWIFVPF